MIYQGCPKAETEPEDNSVLSAFLDFLAEQMQKEPHLIRGLRSLERAEALVGNVEVDPDEDLGDLALPPE